jgi:putative nucleotidyltransferase with HDIG domain
MATPEQLQAQIERIATLVDQGDTAGVRDELVALLEHRHSARRLRALDAAGLLTRIIPELEPARSTDQPSVHFLPVLAHSIEAVAAVDWLFHELQVAKPTTDHRPPTADRQEEEGERGRGGEREIEALPAAIQAYPELRYRSAYAEAFRERFAQLLDAARPRVALFKLATLLHDVAKPQTKQTKPDGDVSFYEHQTIGGEIAREVALRLGFSAEEAAYIRSIVREHMRPGQLATLDEVTLRAVRRFFHATGDAGPDILLHSLADHMATRGPHLNVRAWYAQVAWTDALIETVWGAEIELERPLLNGNELMSEFGLAPGPALGRLLAAIGEAQAGGDITTRAEALELARRLIRKSGENG